MRKQKTGRWRRVVEWTLVVWIGMCGGLGVAELYVRNKLKVLHCPVVRIKGDSQSQVVIDPSDPEWLIISRPLEFQCFVPHPISHPQLPLQQQSMPSLPGLNMVGGF
jgi:hypothetical protein